MKATVEIKEIKFYSVEGLEETFAATTLTCGEAGSCYPVGDSSFAAIAF